MSYEDPSDGKEEAASSMVALSVMVPPTREQLLEQRFGDYEVGFSFPQVAAQAAPAAQPRVTKKAKKRAAPAQVEEGEATSSDVGSSSALKRRSSGVLLIPLPVEMVIDTLETGNVDYIAFRKGVTDMFRSKL